MANTVRTERLSEPLDGAQTASVDIDTESGNLTIDPLGDGEQLLASGTLQYFEKQGRPAHTLTARHGRVTFRLKGGGAERPWFHVPWSACQGAYEWQIHLNPTVTSDITAHSGGGNVRLNLAGMAVTHLAADTDGGNMDVLLPDTAVDLNVSARTGAGNVNIELGSRTTGSNTIDANSGAGNVVVRVPSGIAARIHASSGLGEVVVDPRFSQQDRDTFESPDYDDAASKVEIEAHSGAGDVRVTWP